MFDQVMKRSNWVWIYKMGRFAEERRAYLIDLNKQGHSTQTLRNRARRRSRSTSNHARQSRHRSLRPSWLSVKLLRPK